jgi:hypothetical protein
MNLFSESTPLGLKNDVPEILGAAGLEPFYFEVRILDRLRDGGQRSKIEIPFVP